MPFPPFSDYQETLSAALAPATFATFTAPPWVPTPSQLTRIARIIYPYWRERRTERGGHRIIPTLNVSCLHSHLVSPTDLHAVRRNRHAE